VILNPLGTLATNWPIVPAPDDRRAWSGRWNENWQRKPKYSEKTCPSAILSTTNPRLPDLGSKPATNCLSYGMTTIQTTRVRAAAHQLRQDKHQDMRQKTQSCFIHDSDSSPHTEVARVCVLSHLLYLFALHSCR
jgi:hypothetical protein